MTNKKNKPKYRRGDEYAVEMGRLAEAIWEPAVRDELPGVQRVIAEQAARRVTHREAQCMYLYYRQEKMYREIAEELSINVATISRNIQRGEQKINRVVDFANALMEQTRGGYQV